MPGTLNIRPLQANLTRNTEIFTKMDPYFVVTVGDHKINGPICPKGGLHPHWENPVSIKRGGEKSCNIEIKNKNRIVADDSIAMCDIDLKDIEAKGHTTQWYPATFQGHSAGKILVEVVYNAEKKPDINQFLPQPGHFVPTPGQPQPNIFYPANEPHNKPQPNIFYPANEPHKPQPNIFYPANEPRQQQPNIFYPANEPKQQQPNIFYPANEPQNQAPNQHMGNNKYPDLGNPYNPHNQQQQVNYAPSYPSHRQEEVKVESTGAVKKYNTGRRGVANFPNPNTYIGETKIVAIKVEDGKWMVGRRAV